MLATETVVASVTAGSAATLIGHPLDCIKVRQQALRKPLTPLACASDIFRTQGAPGFFRGCGPSLLNAALMNTVMFAAFEDARRRLPDSTCGSLCAGAISGVVTSVLSTPTDWVKVQAQVRAVAVRDVVAELLLLRPSLLVRTVFTGQTMNMCREGLFTAVYLGLYQQLRAAFICEAGGAPPLPLVAAASATTGALAWVAAFPFDSVKSVQQAQLPGRRGLPIGEAVGLLWRRDGAKAFYRGLSASTARAMLVTGARLFTYEAVLSWTRE